MRYHIVLRPEPEGGFTVMVPALPGCITWAADLEGARAMAREAIEAYVASLVRHGEPVPSGEDELVETVDIQVANG